MSSWVSLRILLFAREISWPVIEKPSLSQQDYAFSVRPDYVVDLTADILPNQVRSFQRSDFYLCVARKWWQKKPYENKPVSHIRNYGAILHFVHEWSRQDISVSSACNKHINLKTTIHIWDLVKSNKSVNNKSPK